MGKRLGLRLWHQHQLLSQLRQQYVSTMANNGEGTEEVDVLLENGLLSFENPGYHLVGLTGRLDDALNSNTTPLSFHDLYEELDSVCKRSATMPQGIGGCGAGEADEAGGNTNPSANVRNRTTYAHLDIASMGVDGAPVTNLDSPIRDDNRNATTPPQGNNLNDANYNNNSEQPPDLIRTHSQPNATESPPEDDSSNSPPSEESEAALPEPLDHPSADAVLPAGWERHEDQDGAYYWHIKSGTIQRELPKDGCPPVARALSCEETVAPTVPRSTSTSSALCEADVDKVESAMKRRSYPARSSSDKAIRFAVRSLGWVEIAEEDLTPERSSKAVNKCIIDLSLGKNDLLDVVGRWGDGKDLYMDLDEGSLKLVDPETLSPLNAQPIHTIRVWGVGRDNGKDFAYVARDRSTRKYMCHVFRCDMPARTIANTLRDICKRIMIERSLQQGGGITAAVGTAAFPPGLLLSGCSDGGISSSPGSTKSRQGAARPTNLPTERRRFRLCGATGQPIVAPETFPTPMEEPKKVLRVRYLGSTMVTRASGMDVLNEAIDHLSCMAPPDSFPQVDVAVAPSMITVSSHPEAPPTMPVPSQQGGGGQQQEIKAPTDFKPKILAECRVRYLSFLGIGKNVKQCAFIMHTAQDMFLAHVFDCEPSSGALCKTIEAACKLRYQKCLDAYPQRVATAGQASEHTPSSRGLGATLKSVIGSLTGRRGGANERES